VQKVGIVRIGADTLNVNGSSEVINGAFTVAAPVTGDPAGTANRLTRSGGNTWNGNNAGDAAFAVGQQVTISGEWSFPSLVFARNSTGDTIKRTDGGNWTSDGFAAGQSFWLSGTTSTKGNLTNNGSFTIKSVSGDGKTLTLTTANTVVPTATFGASEPGTIALSGNFIVTGFSADGKTLMLAGVVLPRQAAVPMTVNVDAPLVVYGDTTQDGVWYNGVATQQSLGKFGSKPQPHMDSVSFTLATPSVGQTNPSLTPAGGVQVSAPYTDFNAVADLQDTFGSLKRNDLGSWITAGFKVNGLVTIGGVAVGTVYGFKSDTADPNAADLLVLNNLLPGYAAGTNNEAVVEWASGSIKLASGQFDPGFVPEGLITIGQTYGSLVFARDTGGDTITRTDGGSFLTDKFAPGQSISISGTTYNDGGGGPNYVITAVTANTITLAAVSQLIPTAQGATESARISVDVGTVTEVGTQYKISFTGTNTINRTDGGNWTTDGFAPNQVIAVYGTGPNGVGTNNQVYKILTVSGTSITVDKPVTPEASEFAIISGGAAKRDTLFLANLQPGFLALLNGAASASLTDTVVERNRLGQNADFFVFPLAAQYAFDGNNVIDAHNLFAGIPDGQLPPVGITAYGGRGDDTILGSAASDFLAGGSGNDMILGGRGGDQIFGDNGINVDVIRRLLTVAQAAGTSGAVNVDPLIAGNDLLYGDAPGSTVTNAFGDYNDLIFGDLGDVGQAVAGARDTTKPLFDATKPVGTSVPITPQRIETTGFDVTVTSQSRQNGADDTIYGNGGDEVLIGGTGNDAIDGGTGRDLVFGDNVSLDRTGHFGNFTNPRFETLQGTQIYSTAPTTAGQDLASNDSQADPRGHGAWGDYLIVMYDTLPDKTKSVTVPGAFGNDYIAGGPADDMLFGQAGNDTVQGDGSIDYVSHVLMDDGNVHMIPNPAYPIGGRVGVLNVAANYAGNPFRDATNALVLRPSFDAASDGQDHVVGNAGNDVLFGNQGQDDLIGGNSDMFSLSTPSLRPDGSDLIFGGSGIAIARNAIGDATLQDAVPGNGDQSVIVTTANGHANDSDAIVGDNGDIIRLVGINGQVAPPVGAQVLVGSLTQAGNPVQSCNGFLSFNYDTSLYDATVKIIPRAVRLIDYTPGGPDLNAAAAANDIGAADEIHGESGDDFVYGGKGDDGLFGEGQNDDVIGGYGNDWISGVPAMTAYSATTGGSSRAATA
jgi:Ca2+-binding RTX toxin-like protein